MQEYLGGQLPDYMVPAYFVYLERIPLTPSGKIDRRGVAGTGSEKRKKLCWRPGIEIEEKLVEIWRGILGIKALPNAR